MCSNSCLRCFPVSLINSCIFAFFFGYGIVENLIRKWVKNRKPGELKFPPRTMDKSPDPRGMDMGTFAKTSG